MFKYFQIFYSKNKFLLGCFPVAKWERRIWFLNVVVREERLAAGTRTNERNSTLVVRFLDIDYISAWQYQMDVAWISVWAPKCPPRAWGEYSHNLAHDKALRYGAYAEIPSSACSGQLLTKFFPYSVSNASC